MEPLITSVTSEINTNFNLNVVVNEPADTTPCNASADANSVLEYIREPFRMTSLITLPQNGHLPRQPRAQGLEILVIDGDCTDGNTDYPGSSYLRFPQFRDIRSRNGCRLFVKYNQFLPDDEGERNIDTSDPDKWFPGPVDGISIRPLHVFKTESIMLLHWKNACEFRPKLDPQGEEILVLTGLLQNKDQLYKPNSWIRNPVEDWLDWHGSSNTLLYYKSGHFPDHTDLAM
ncbi:hypothetical protein AB833_07145 [Chromatiales bacterium (ex Bugula neritina AB1)]|nr:hypothetical protein AB833_07145 [Chromatiales bacterium (ex Bugula neritina AB1)]